MGDETEELQQLMAEYNIVQVGWPFLRAAKLLLVLLLVRFVTEGIPSDSLAPWVYHSLLDATWVKLQVPTFLFFRNGKEAGRHVGSSRGDLIGQILQQQSAFGIPPPPPQVGP